LNDSLAKIKLSDLNKSEFASWRDRRTKEVSNLSVLREWALLSHAIEIAIREWDWMKENPMKALKKPVGEPPRDRLITDDEIERLCFALNYKENAPLPMITQRVGAAFLFAIETALRAQEICNLRWDDIKGRTIKVNASKTLAGVRQVPLSPRAISIIEQLKGVDGELVFNLKTSQLDSLFRKAKKQVLIENLHFHDSRHLAITNLAKKLDVLELARMVGHKDLNMLLVY
jgi:integrase